MRPGWKDFATHPQELRRDKRHMVVMAGYFDASRGGNLVTSERTAGL